jgi:hypothetical protein
MTAGSPLACRLDALTDEQHARRTALGARLRPRATDVRELEDRYGLRLPSDPTTLSEATEFAALGGGAAHSSASPSNWSRMPVRRGCTSRGRRA